MEHCNQSTAKFERNNDFFFQVMATTLFDSEMIFQLSRVLALVVLGSDREGRETLALSSDLKCKCRHI